jgi:lipopolysaccharide/colanic/teichoic acid biosynthesis glycosyltransferase
MSTSVLTAEAAPGYVPWASENAVIDMSAALSYGGGRQLKRALDLVATTLILVLVLPTFLFIGLLVLVSSRGPILFRQQRVGLNGTPFTLLKFRTMYHGASSAVHETYYRALMEGTAQPTGNTFKLRNDPRITPLGRVLRRLSLDELPQLINVLRGDMSLVGPRPPLPYEVEHYGPRELGRLSVPPGLTGLWQVSGRAILNFHQMIDLDLIYIQRWSLWLDLKILALTPLVVLTGRGAC